MACAGSLIDARRTPVGDQGSGHETDRVLDVALRAALVAQRRQQLRVERREQEVGDDLGVVARAQLAEQPADVTVPDGIGAGAQPRTRATGAFSFLVATAAMLTLLAVLPRVAGPARPRAAALAAVPWWGWLGGLCGATYVTSVFVAIPHIGAAATVALTVAGQQVASVFVDRHGLLRLPRRPIPPARLLGVVLLLAGVVLIELA
jgi:uncharacterized membrane protein YdcZ (DUF606 family)